MTTTSERYLQKQVARQQAQIDVLMRAFENLLTENEVLGSIACAFAFDLGLHLQYSQPISELEYRMTEMWDEAVKAVGG